MSDPQPPQRDDGPSRQVPPSEQARSEQAPSEQAPSEQAPSQPGQAYAQAPAPGQAYAQTPASAAAPAYPTAPDYSPVAAPARPGRVLGIVAFVMSFFGGINVIALILGIVALVQSRKAGQKNGFALAAIIISAVLIVVGIVAIIVLVSVGTAAFHQLCDQLGPGVHTSTNGGASTTVTCPG